MHRVRILLETSPDAVVVVDGSGTIVEVNRLATELLGYPPEELVGRPVEVLVPEGVRSQHQDHRERFLLRRTKRPMAAGQDLYARHRDGHAVPVDIALAPLEGEDGPVVAAFVRDARPRREVEQQQQRLRDAQRAREGALELNDNVVQSLTAAVWLLESGSPERALETLRGTLVAAREIMTDMLDLGEHALQPGQLRRSGPPPSTGVGLNGEGRPAGAVDEPVATGPVRVVLADDAEDLRLLLRIRLESAGDVEVVAEATDGREALAAVDEHVPDVVLLDVSMPDMDGLEAAAELRRRHPGLRIVVLSGHSGTSLGERARAAGADVYLEKGRDFGEVVEAVMAGAVR